MMADDKIILDFNDAPVLRVIDPKDYDERLARLRNHLSGHAEEVVRQVFPLARIQRGEARIGNIEGEQGESLSIGLTGDRAGLWYDHATGDGGDLIDLWQRSTNDPDFLSVVEDLERWCGLSSAPRWTSRVHKVAERRQKEATAAPKLELGPPTGVWEYKTASGVLIATVRRYDLADGKKTFRPTLANGAAGMPDPRPLYRLPDLTTADEVILVEGEKCADALASLGIIATTAMGGASANPSKTDWTPLAGKRVIIWPDNDEPGRAMPEKVRGALESVGASVIVLSPPPGKPTKWDAADAVAEGFDVPALLHPKPSALRFRILTVDELLNVKPPEWRIDGIFPCHGSTVIYGAYETYKTFITLDMVLALATGRPWHGRETKPCSVLYIAGEGQVGLGLRVAGWLSAKGLAAPDVRFRALPEAVAFPNTGDRDDLLRAIEAMPEPPEVIVADTVTRMTGGGSLNDEKDAQGYVAGSDHIRRATGAHMLHVGHSGKDQTKGILGSIVLPAAMETIICVERASDRLKLINSNPKGKQKDGPNFDDVPMRMQKVEFNHKGEVLSTLVPMLDNDPVKPEAEPAQPLGPLQSKLLAMIEQAAREGRGLGFTSLVSASGSDRGTVGVALRKMVQRGLIIETGEEGSRRWMLP